MEIRSPSVYGSNESFSESPFRFWRLHLSAPSININWSLQTYKKTAIFSPPTQRSGYVPWGHHWHEFLKRKLVLEIVSQCWIITAPSENSLFPLLEWLWLFCGGLDADPTIGPIDLLQHFCPLEQSLQSQFASGKVAFSAALINTRCTVDFDPIFAGSNLISSRNTHTAWVVAIGADVSFLYFLPQHNCANTDDRIVSQAGATCQVGGGSGPAYA